MARDITGIDSDHPLGTGEGSRSQEFFAGSVSEVGEASELRLRQDLIFVKSYHNSFLRHRAVRLHLLDQNNYFEASIDIILPFGGEISEGRGSLVCH